MPRLDKQLESSLLALARRMVDQQQARVIVSPQQSASGFWFGGGNLVRDRDGSLVLVGRYRNVGDSRTGLGAGQRGLELACFRSTDGGSTFAKMLSFSKADLNVGDRQVLSIEGSAIHLTANGVELFVSSEKTGVDYPESLRNHLKPGTGVWTIDRLQADSIDRLQDATPLTLLESDDPLHLHLKDPFVYEAANHDSYLLFCTHPFCWSSSNTAYAVRKSGQIEFGDLDREVFPRGPAWDVAITRGTALVDLPKVGLFRDLDIRLMFYDGGESLRNLDEHEAAVRRPRGYSCEELGGVAYVVGEDLSNLYRLSTEFPTFVSPYGTGCSRYVDVLATDSDFYVTWQQAQEDGSQPLVINRVRRSEVESILKGEF